jgi:exodeoxyribonuclease VII small subunit
MARPRSAGSPEPEVTFEQAMTELEDIVHVLEDSRLPLDELVEKYERGAGLLRICQKRLSAAQQRIELITRSSGEAPQLEPFPEGGTAPAVPASSPKPPRKTSSSDHANIDEIRLL